MNVSACMTSDVRICAPDDTIQDATGNFGTPMSGIITVLPED